MDRRVRYTKKVLNESLIGFLEQKEITQITVTEICREADINRSTYYVYYRDVFDQLAKLKAELLEELAKQTELPIPEGISSVERRFLIFRAILNYTREYKHIFQIFLTRIGDHNLQHDLLKMLGDRVFMPDNAVHGREYEQNYRVIYAANGCFGIFYEWLMSVDFIDIESTAQIMAEFSESVCRCDSI